MKAAVWLISAAAWHSVAGAMIAWWLSALAWYAHATIPAAEWSAVIGLVGGMWPWGVAAKTRAPVGVRPADVLLCSVTGLGSALGALAEFAAPGGAVGGLLTVAGVTSALWLVLNDEQ